ncbi:PucR family transcriptional regulator [Nocardia sp. NPDC004750]
MPEATSRLLPDDWNAVAVGPHPRRWGRLILRADGVATARARMVLERAAQTLTLHRMIEKDRFGPHRQARTGLIDDLVNGRRDERDALARAAALGLARRAVYVPLAVEVAAAAESDPLAGQRRTTGIVDAVTHGLGLAKVTALVATGPGDRVSLIVALPRAGDPDEALPAARAAMLGEVRRVDGVRGVVIGAGTVSDTAHGVPHAAHVALSLGTSASRPFYRSGDVRLRGLLSLIRAEPGVQRFAETELSSLLRYDIRHDADLTRTLRQFLDLAGNKTELARRLGISGPTLYERLARIARILEVDLDDGESRTSLHTALLIRDLTAGPGQG